VILVELGARRERNLFRRFDQTDRVRGGKFPSCNREVFSTLQPANNYVFGIAASPDHSSILYDQKECESSIMLVKNFGAEPPEG